MDSRTLALENKMGARLSKAAGTGGISPGRAIRVSHVAIHTLTLSLQGTLPTFQLGDFKWNTRIKTKSQHIKEVGSLAGRQASFQPFTMLAQVIFLRAEYAFKTAQWFPIALGIEFKLLSMAKKSL